MASAFPAIHKPDCGCEPLARLLGDQPVQLCPRAVLLPYSPRQTRIERGSHVRTLSYTPPLTDRRTYSLTSSHLIRNASHLLKKATTMKENEGEDPRLGPFPSTPKCDCTVSARRTYSYYNCSRCPRLRFCRSADHTLRERHPLTPTQGEKLVKNASPEGGPSTPARHCRDYAILVPRPDHLSAGRRTCTHLSGGSSERPTVPSARNAGTNQGSPDEEGRRRTPSQQEGHNATLVPPGETCVLAGLSTAPPSQAIGISGVQARQRQRSVGEY